MNESKTLPELFVHELCDAYDSETQLTKALRKMASTAQNPDLEAAFTGHLHETVGQLKVLDEVFALLDQKPKAKHSDGIAGVLKEESGDQDHMPKSAVRDAVLIGGGRRAEHYEIAAYGSLIAMGEELDYAEACQKLRGILAQEEAADKKLAGLAKKINADAHKESMAKA
jgi:ferritin-like metal-binding protein YciE